MAVQKLLPVIERELEPFQPRPHWAKLFSVTPADLKARYAKMPEFVALARKWDPSGKFQNAFLDENIFGG